MNRIATHSTRVRAVSPRRRRSQLRCPNSDPRGQILTCPQRKHSVPFLKTFLSCCHRDLHPHPCHSAKHQPTRSLPRDRRTPVWLGPCPTPWRQSEEGGSPGQTQLTWNSENLLGGAGIFFMLPNDTSSSGAGLERVVFLLFSQPPWAARGRRHL